MTRRVDLIPDRREAIAIEAVMRLRGWSQAAIDTLVDDLDDDEAFSAMAYEGRKLLAAIDGVPPQPRKAGPLNAVDASALGNDLGAFELRILARHADGTAHVVAWARGRGTHAYGRLPSSLLWGAFAESLTALETATPPEAES